MAESIAASPAPVPRKRRVWLRVAGWVIGILVVLLVALYFFVTSPAFFKDNILPRVGRSIHANVTVSSAEIHPFSQIVLRDLKVQPTNQPTLVNVAEVRVKYSLFAILGGNIRVDELALVAPTVQIIEDEFGRSNLDPLLNPEGQPAEQEVKQPVTPSKPPRIDLRKLTVSNGTVLQIQKHKAGTRGMVELTNVDITLTGVKNGESGKLQFSAILRDDDNPPAPAMYGLLAAKLDGNFGFSFTPDFRPGSILGDAHMDISQAAGAYSDFAKLNGTLHCDVTPTDIKEVTLRFQKDGVRLGDAHVRGPLDLEKREGQLTVELLLIDKQVLNLFAAKSGFDFGSTTINSSTQIQLAKGGSAISAVGQLSASKFQLTRTNETTPPLEVRTEYNLSLDNTEKTALLRAFNLSGTQNGRPLFRGELTSPMTLAWGKATNAVGESSFNFAITKLNVADWKAFAGGLASAGTLDLTLKFLSQQGGTQLTFDVNSQIQNLTARSGGQGIADADVTLQAHGRSTDLKQFNVSQYTLQLAQSNQTALTVSGSGAFNQPDNTAELQVSLQTTLARLLPMLGRSDVVASAGNAGLKAHVTQKQEAQTVVGTLSLTNFTGKFGSNEFRNFGATMDVDLAKTPDEIEIHKVAGKLSEGGVAGGDFDASGTYGIAGKASQVAVKLSNINQNGLRPFLEPLFADKNLVSIAVNGTASAQRSAIGDASIKADVQVANLVVNDSTQKLPAPALGAKLQMDAGIAKDIADIRQFQLTLTPTERAKNQLTLQGRVDMSRTNAIQGSLKLAADSLDLTSYYDLVATTNIPTTTAAETKPGTSSTIAAGGPQPSQGSLTNQLPFKNFTFDANVRELYLREIAATNFHSTVKLDGSRILLKPFAFVLNNSPVNATADVDMGVPGYKYAVTFNATNVPFAPLWNTFKPEEKDKMGGTLTALVNISGTGTSGEALQKTLAGSFNIGTTNLNLDVTTIHNRVLRQIIAVVAKVPELCENPLVASENLAVGLVGSVMGKYSGGLADDLAKSPIDIISMRGTAASGRIMVEQATVRSTVFEATVTNGTVTLAPVLTNSTLNLPISISLQKSIPPRIPLLSFLTPPTNSSYTKLPDFYVVKGTAGDPKASISVKAISKDALQNLIPGLIGAGTNSAGTLLQGLGGLLQGGANTNLVNTNQPPANNLLNQLLGPGRK